MANLKDLQESYSGGFTIHGLSRVCNGSKTERIIWSLMLLLCLAAIGLVVVSFVKQYNRKEIYTTTTIVSTDKNYFPAMTFCLPPLKKETYCSIGILTRTFPIHAQEDKPCIYPNFTLASSNISIIKYPWATIWESVNFATYCSRYMYFCEDINLDHINITEHSNSACITINGKGTYHNLRNKLSFQLTSFSRYVYYVDFKAHSAKENGFFKDQTLRINLARGYEIKIEKKKYKRLPSPFPSNCTSYSKDNIFPGAYSLMSCYDSMKCLEAYKKCGDTYDFCREYIPKDVVMNYKKNSTLRATYTCLQNIEKSFNAKCQVPCEEESYSVSASVMYTNRRYPILRIGYQNPNEYTLIEEHEKYTFETLLSDVGGLTGLLIGASILSLVELVAYSIIRVLRYFQQHYMKIDYYLCGTISKN